MSDYYKNLLNRYDPTNKKGNPPLWIGCAMRRDLDDSASLAPDDIDHTLPLGEHLARVHRLAVKVNSAGSPDNFEELPEEQAAAEIEADLCRHRAKYSRTRSNRQLRSME